MGSSASLDDVPEKDEEEEEADDSEEQEGEIEEEMEKRPVKVPKIDEKALGDHVESPYVTLAQLYWEYWAKRRRKEKRTKRLQKPQSV